MILVTASSTILWTCVHSSSATLPELISWIYLLPPLYISMLLLLLLSRFSHVRLCATPEIAAHQAPLSLGFSRQEHWSGLPFLSPYVSIMELILVILEWPSSFPNFLQSKPDICHKKLLFWAAVSSMSCFYWLYEASPFSAAKNIINLIQY